MLLLGFVTRAGALSHAAQNATRNAAQNSGQAPPSVSPKSPLFCSACVHADMAFLADDELQGRGSGTRDEHLAAAFAAALLESFGLEAGGDQGTFLQKINLPGDNPGHNRQTWNAIGILRGSNGSNGSNGSKNSNNSNASESKTHEEAILLTAHIDHLGIGPAVNGDTIYNGADDDASGVTAVLEIARAISRSRPRRTVIFVLFGSEETGSLGSRYFVQHPPVALSRIVANISFEMIGRNDPMVPPGSCWLTGYERSDLGSELAKHGAPLVRDPRPQQKFFQRSDNYPLARAGVVAHTISSFGLHGDYHQPSDDLGGIDFNHLTQVIRSMILPIEWLANTDWKPSWKAGGQPK